MAFYCVVVSYSFDIFMNQMQPSNTDTHSSNYHYTDIYDDKFNINLETLSRWFSISRCQGNLGIQSFYGTRKIAIKLLSG